MQDWKNVCSFPASQPSRSRRADAPLLLADALSAFSRRSFPSSGELTPASPPADNPLSFIDAIKCSCTNTFSAACAFPSASRTDPSPHFPRSPSSLARSQSRSASTASCRRTSASSTSACPRSRPTRRPSSTACARSAGSARRSSAASRRPSRARGSRTRTLVRESSCSRGLKVGRSWLTRSGRAGEPAQGYPTTTSIGPGGIDYGSAQGASTGVLTGGGARRAWALVVALAAAGGLAAVL